MSRYHHVDAMKAEGFAIRAACRAAEVSSAAYYEWKEHDLAGPTEHAQAEADLVAEIREIHRELDQSYGSSRITRELRRRGRPVNHKRVERLMRFILGFPPLTGHVAMRPGPSSDDGS